MNITPGSTINGIALRGKRRAGKDTVCRLLMEHSSIFARVAFAEQLKLDICDAFGVTLGWLERNKKDDIVRTSLQAWGQRAKEINGPNYWIKRAEKKIREVIVIGKVPVVTDLRFPQEVEYCNQASIVTVQVLGRDDNNSDPMSQDISETAIDNIPADIVIDNRMRNMSHLREQVNNLLMRLVVSTDFRSKLLSPH